MSSRTSSLSSRAARPPEKDQVHRIGGGHAEFRRGAEARARRVGVVYRGYLNELGLEVAIKRVSKGSTQGRKQYADEVSIIS